MSKRSVVLVVATLTLLLGASVLTSHTTALTRPAAPSPFARRGAPPQHLAQVRGEYIQLSGNNDVTNSTCTIVNTSLSTTIYLGDAYALGPNGLSEVLAVDTGLNGVGIPPLGSLDLPVNSVNFPGLQPKVHADSRGLESVLVTWSGFSDALSLTAAIVTQLPGDLDSRMISRAEGHYATK